MPIDATNEVSPKQAVITDWKIDLPALIIALDVEYSDILDAMVQAEMTLSPEVVRPTRIALIEARTKLRKIEAAEE